MTSDLTITDQSQSPSRSNLENLEPSEVPVDVRREDPDPGVDPEGQADPGQRRLPLWSRLRPAAAAAALLGLHGIKKSFFLSLS